MTLEWGKNPLKRVMKVSQIVPQIFWYISIQHFIRFPQRSSLLPTVWNGLQNKINILQVHHQIKNKFSMSMKTPWIHII
jgi:hypothetical protein